MTSLLTSALFFFFQAEDGIRDLYVTGVQTCALPILDAYRAGALDRLLLVNAQFVNTMTQRPAVVQLLPIEALDTEGLQERSEERRVGKECRSRWWPDE